MKASPLGLVIAVLLLTVGCKNNEPSSSLMYSSAVGALGPYSGTVTSGNLIFVSGKIGKRGESFEIEARTAIDAVEDELRRSGSSLADVISVTLYLTDLELYSEFNSIYKERFIEPYPARACVEVSKIPGNARLEIQVIAKSQ